MRTSIFTLHANDGKMEVEIPDRACVNVIWNKVFEHVGQIDDAGCDWYTDSAGAVFINGDWGWFVTSDQSIGKMVDVANILTIGRVLKMEPAEADDELTPERMRANSDRIHNALLASFHGR